MMAKMSNKYIIDLREDEGNNAEVSITFYSPLLIISSRELYENEKKSLDESGIEFELKITNEKYSDILFVESLKHTGIKSVCVNTGRLLSLEVNVYEFQGKAFGLQARNKLLSLKSKILSSSLSPILKDNIVKYVSFLDNVSIYDERFISKDGFFVENEVWNRKDESYLEMLNLVELDKINDFYHESVFNFYLCTNHLRQNKSSCLNDISGLRNNNDVNFIKIDGYPISLKLLSSLYIKAAEFKLSSNVLSSSFMYSFRALEVYCDGLLVFFGKARIGDALNRNGQIFKPNTLLVNDRFVSGFGGKWTEIKNKNEFRAIDSNIISEVERIKELRNNFILTHGNIKITKEIAKYTIDVVSDFIISFEDEINQQAAKWVNISERVNKLLYFDIYSEIAHFCRERDF